MAQKTAFPFGTLMPGFDFMNQLASAGAQGAAAPGLQQWIAPTVDVDELERRIKELKTVQFWLEQNLLGVKASVQALEVQKMTLQTLQGMNLSMGEIAKAFTLPGAPADAPKADARAPAPRPGKATGGTGDQDTPRAPVADPLQWWGALSQQFQQIAAQALQETAARSIPPVPRSTAAKAASDKASTTPAAARKATRKKPAAKPTPRNGKAGAANPRKATPKK